VNRTDQATFQHWRLAWELVLCGAFENRSNLRQTFEPHGTDDRCKIPIDGKDTLRMNVEDPSGGIIACREPFEIVREADRSPRHDTSEVDDPSYHAARERAERRAAKESNSVSARRAHQELAQAHAELARKLEGRA
jgi:hypothetical protein